MAVRDRARSDLYLAQLRSQSVPNTPGFAQNGLPSAREGGWRPPVEYFPSTDISDAEKGGARDEKGRFVVVEPKTFTEPKPFSLMPAPVKLKDATPRVKQASFASPSTTPPPPMPPASPVQELRQEHVPAAPGERTYGQVSIPGSYASPLASPGYAPANQQFDFGLDKQSKR